MYTSSRRNFIKRTATGAAVLGLGNLAFLGCIPPVSADDAQLDPKRVRLDGGIEPLVIFLETTPREKLLEEIAGRIKKGLSYRDVLTALFLAGIRNIRPTGGFNFHAVLVIHSAHQASLAAPDTERWLPLFWALDEFKRVQTVSEKGDKGWRMGPAEEAKIPSARNARQAYQTAVEKWDVNAAEAAIISLARSAGAGEIFDLLALHGACNFSGLGHPAIFVSNGWRTLQCIGWQHAEPVLRSLVRVVFERKPEALWTGNRDLATQLPAEWQEGKLTPGATTDLMAAMRQAKPAEIAQQVLSLLKSGVAPQSIWDAAFAGAGELLMRQPSLPGNWDASVFSLHSATSMNALRYAYSVSQDDTRRLLLLQAASIIPVFIETMHRRGGKVLDGRIDQLEPAPLEAAGADSTGEIFAEIGADRILAARKALTYLKENPHPREFMNAARLLVFLKGADSHDYKFSSAAFEDYDHISPAWRDRWLANSMYILRGSGDKDNALINRARAALKA